MDTVSSNNPSRSSTRRGHRTAKEEEDLRKLAAIAKAIVFQDEGVRSLFSGLPQDSQATGSGNPVKKRKRHLKNF